MKKTKKNLVFMIGLLGFCFFQINQATASQKAKIPFLEIVKNESVTSVVKALGSLKDLNQKDSEGNTALHLAVMRGDEEIVEFLLRKKANFMVPNARGKSAKSLANDKGDESILELFRKQIEYNRADVKDFNKVFKKITAQRPHCCRFYGQLKSNDHILVLVQKTVANGECGLEGYNPPKQNLFFGNCHTDLTYDGCKAHFQNPGVCKDECGWGDKPDC